MWIGQTTLKPQVIARSPGTGGLEPRSGAGHPLPCHRWGLRVVIGGEPWEVLDMAHVELVERPRGLVPRLAAVYGRRRFGRDVEPVQAASHHAGVLVAAGLMETAAGRGWRKLDPHLALLAVQAAAGAIGCSWCMDFGYYENLQRGQDPAKIRDMVAWRESSVYSDRERAVLEYAEAASSTPAVVSSELVSRLHTHFNESEIVELAAWVALENYRSRFNAGLGLRSQGFSDSCRVPEAL
jgi:alkylhydroperoxidase family enzyme